MFLWKKRKVESKRRLFQEKWIDEHFYVSVNGKALFDLK
jgi:hypothetical protein